MQIHISIFDEVGMEHKDLRVLSAPTERAGDVLDSLEEYAVENLDCEIVSD